MKTASTTDFGSTNKPLVVGAPRTGFTLLISVVSHLLPFVGGSVAWRGRVLREFIKRTDLHIANSVCAAASKLGVESKLVYSPSFRGTLGGPHWVIPEQPDTALFRKYIGVGGHGDFTLITRHPRVVLDCHDIFHTHINPDYWTARATAEGMMPLASVRDPVGTLYSSCFSINALTSEYLQHFVTPELDSDATREELALYKLTNLDFFQGLVGPLKNYLEEFVSVRERFRYVMHWEDLLTYPLRTIAEIGEALGAPVDQGVAEEIWRSIGWRNLTGSHKHNYRNGHGIIGGWRRYLTNEHLSLIRESGLEKLSIELGYGPVADLDPGAYSEYQSRVAAMISAGEIYRDYTDRDLFEFAFNKSNLDSSAFPFRQYDWRQHTRVERSSMADETLVMPMWDAAETAAAGYNAALDDLTDILAFDAGQAASGIEDFVEDHQSVFGAAKDDATSALVVACRQERKEPQLLRSVENINIVKYGSDYFAVPQSLGPIDLTQTDVEPLAGVLKASSYGQLLASLRDAPQV